MIGVPANVGTFFILFLGRMKEIAIIGGGLAGLINAILLNRSGISVTLFEEKKYPFHRVCGEYISNEVIPFLRYEGLYPDELAPQPITNFHLSSPSGKEVKMPLDLGGFGLSRYAFDHWLYNKAEKEGVHFVFDRVLSCQFHENQFHIQTRNDIERTFDVSIGCFGKRSTMDKSLERNFINQRSPYVGVKYHLQTEEVPDDTIALHNFKEGYCGISRIENKTYNLCYLTHRDNLKTCGTIPGMEDEILAKNPHLNRIFKNSTFLFPQPEVINEISFEPKEPVFNHILMSGDSAGMITPLCGNGMAMAIHSAYLLSNLIIENAEAGFDREKLEQAYTLIWRRHFQKRLRVGRKIQHLFGASILSETFVNLVNTLPWFGGYLMKQTHGKPF